MISSGYIMALSVGEKIKWKSHVRPGVSL